MMSLILQETDFQEFKAEESSSGPTWTEWKPATTSAARHPSQLPRTAFDPPMSFVLPSVFKVKVYPRLVLIP